VAPWHRDIPARFRSLEVEAAGGCVIIFGRTAINAEEPERLIQCLDPDTGDDKWTRLLPVPGGLIRDEIRTVPGIVMHRSARGVVALDAITGRTVWTFDSGGRAIDRDTVHDGGLFLSLDSDTLVTLDVETGAWLSGHTWSDHTLIGVTSAEGRTVAIVVSGDGQDSELLGLDLRRSGGTAPAPPFPSPPVLWRAPAEPDAKYHVVDGVVVGVSVLKLTTFSASEGEVIYDATRRPAREGNAPRDPGMRSFPADHPGLSHLDPVDLAPSRRSLLAGGTVVASRGIYTHQVHEGVMIDVLQIIALRPQDFSPRWTAAWSSTATRVTVRELPSLAAVLIARPGEVSVLDLDTGRHLARATIDPLRAGWTSVATDGRGLYVLYGHDPVPRLEAVPWTMPERDRLP
jgi:hypothetical protein